MPHAPLSNDLPHSRHDIMRTHPGRFVDNQRAIHFSDCIFCVPPCPLWLNIKSFTTEGTEENYNEARKKSLRSIPRLRVSASFSARQSYSPPNNVPSKNYESGYWQAAARRKRMSTR